MNEARTCKTCRYWVKVNEDMGDCHRMPPHSQPGYMASFPKVLHFEWCGEWVMFKGKAK